jgi:predicted nucleic acid-binding protein
VVKYALDTNLYIRSVRDDAFRAELKAFQASYAPQVHLSTVVFHEIHVGASSAAHARDIEDSFSRFGDLPQRIVTPSHAAWLRAGEALSALATRQGMERSRIPRALVNDALIATSCLEAGVTLLTDNLYDFERLAEHIPLRFAPPWPPTRKLR